MTDFELQLEVPPLTDEQEDAVLDTFDAFIGDHGGTTLITMTAEGPTCEAAFRHAAHDLAASTIRVTRLVEDLVTRKTIASRAGVTPQGVGLWVRGERQHEDPFPQPFTLAGGGLWLWGEVNEWLARHDHQHDDLAFPTREDYVRCNAWLLEQATPQPQWHVISTVQVQVPATTAEGSAAPLGAFQPFPLRDVA